MKISTEIGSIAKIVGMEKAVELCAKAGFDAWDFSMFDMCRIDKATGLPLQNKNEMNGPNYLEFARTLRKIGEDNGIICNQTHAPFPVYSPAVYSFLERAIECSAEVGAEICVIHPDNYKTAAENARMYQQLLPYAKSCGVKIATENMWLWDNEKDESSFAACATGEDFKKHLDAVNDPFLVACLDIGHAEMRGSGDGAASMVRKLGSSLQALHIHDNDRWHDSHMLPFTMDIDFAPILQALKDIGYQGYFTLEANSFIKDYTEDTIFDGVLTMRNCVRKLADQFEQL